MTARPMAAWTCPACGRGYVAPADGRPSCAGATSGGGTPHDPVALVMGRVLARRSEPTGKFPYP